MEMMLRILENRFVSSYPVFQAFTPSPSCLAYILPKGYPEQQRAAPNVDGTARSHVHMIQPYKEFAKNCVPVSVLRMTSH